MLPKCNAVGHQLGGVTVMKIYRTDYLAGTQRKLHQRKIVATGEFSGHRDCGARDGDHRRGT
jgi:hypothetical protein